MLTSPTFSTDLWLRNLGQIGARHAAIASELVVYLGLELGAKAHHRASALAGSSDRQTIFRHPETGLNFLVISIAKDDASQLPFSLRIDFFDRTETVSASFGKIVRAPRTQWTKKFERRVFVPENADSTELREFVQSVLLAAAKAEVA